MTRLSLLVTAFALATSPAAAQPRTDAVGDPLPDAAVARLGTVRLQHANGALSVAFLDNKTLISCGGDQKVSFWEMPTGRRQKSKLPADAAAQWLDLSRDGSTLATTLGGSHVTIYDTATGKGLAAFQFEESYARALSADGKLLSTSGGQKQAAVKLYDVATGKYLRELGNVGPYLSCHAFAPDGKTLAVGAQERCVTLLDVATGKMLRQLDEAPGNVHRFLFTADGKRLIASTSRGLYVWDVATGTRAGTFCEGKALGGGLALSRDGTVLAVALADGTAAQVDPITLKSLGRCGAAGPCLFEQLSLSPDGKVLAGTRANDSRVYLFDTASGKPLRERPGHGGNVTWVAVAPDSTRAATVSNDHTLRLWDLTTFQEIRRLSDEGLPLVCCAFAPDGKSVASVVASNDDANVVRLWDAESGKSLRTLGKPGKSLRVVTFSPDGKWLAAAGSGEQIRIWQPDTGTELPPLRLKKGSFSPGLVFALGGDRLVSAHYDHKLHFWDVDAARAVRNRADHRGSVLSLAVGGDGTVLASGAADGLAILYDPEKAVILAKCDTGHSHVFAVAVSPDGRWLATTGIDMKIQLWEVATGQRLGEFAGHEAWVHSLAFTPDGKRLLSASDDTTVLVWDMRKLMGREPLPPRKLDDEQLKALWRDLGASEPRPANEAVRVLAAAPTQAVALLRVRLQPPAAAKEIPGLIAQLDNKSFAVREKAMAALRELGPLAEEALRKALEDQPTAEVRARTEKLLAALAEPEPDSARHGARAVRVASLLEEIGTAEAQALLQELARDAAGTRLGREARAALKRLRPG